MLNKVVIRVFFESLKLGHRWRSYPVVALIPLRQIPNARCRGSETTDH